MMAWALPSRSVLQHTHEKICCCDQHMGASRHGAQFDFATVSPSALLQ